MKGHWKFRHSLLHDQESLEPINVTIQEQDNNLVWIKHTSENTYIPDSHYGWPVFLNRPFSLKLDGIYGKIISGKYKKSRWKRDFLSELIVVFSRLYRHIYEFVWANKLACSLKRVWFDRLYIPYIALNGNPQSVLAIWIICV